jgi:phosphate transport system protein
MKSNDVLRESVEMGDHLRTIDHDLNRLRDKLLVLGGSAETAIALATRSLVERDCDLAEQVIRDDDKIDELENEVDAICIDILALRQPTASDLRFVVAAAKTAPAIERIADHAVNIARHALRLNLQPQLKPYLDLPRMAETVQQMLLDGLDAFTSSNADQAIETIKHDDRVDEFYKRIYDELIHLMRTDPTTITRCVELLFVIKHLERIADYVTNICEQTVYMARGQVIKHKVW